MIRPMQLMLWLTIDMIKGFMSRVGWLRPFLGIFVTDVKLDCVGCLASWMINKSIRDMVWKWKSISHR